VALAGSGKSAVLNVSSASANCDALIVNAVYQVSSVPGIDKGGASASAMEYYE